MRKTALLLATLTLLVARPSAAEKLPGLLEASVIEAGKQKAAQQKRDAQKVVEGHAKALGYNRTQIADALKPTMVRSGSFTVSLSDGTRIELPWYRIGFAENRIANTSKKIARDAAGNALRHETNKGGVRLHHGVYADEVYALALKMDTKLAITRDAINGYAMRGAKGGIGAGRVVAVGTRYQAKVGDYVDPASPVLDRAAIMRKFAASYRASGGDVGPGLDIQAGDVNTKAPEMKVLSIAYGSRRTPSAGVSGKAVAYRKDGTINPKGGIEYRAISTGEGTWMSARLAAHRVGLKLRGATVFCQGWGEVGKAFGLAAVKDGGRIVGIQEVWNVGGKKVVGTLLHPKGAKAKPREMKQWIADVEQLRASGQDLKTYKGGALARHFKAGVDASQVKADIVGNNALGNVLTEKTVPAYVRSGTHQGKRKIAVEGANLAETAAGARLIDKHKSKLLVVPGDLANLGGVHVSNLEAVQNLYKEPVSSKRAKSSLLGTIRSAWNKVVKLSAQQGITERMAVERVAVDGMMRRSLQITGAPRSSLERRVISAQRRSANPHLLTSLAAGLSGTPKAPVRTRIKQTSYRPRTKRTPWQRTTRIKRSPTRRSFRKR